jgi:flagellar biosynthesis GTPase FlhF
LSLLAPEEIHWVANATVRKENHLADAQRFVAMGATHLLFTRMEEAVEKNSLLDLMNEVHLPLGFYSDGTDLLGDLKEADLDWITEKDDSKKTNNNLIWGEAHKAKERHRPQLVEHNNNS